MHNVVAVGVDIVPVARVFRLLRENDDWRIGVLSDGEWTYCRRQHRPAQHVAARFAAKEAWLKALGVGLGSVDGLVDIEVARNALGKPYFRLHRSAKLLAARWGVMAMDVSLSHCADMAIANVVINRE